MAKNETHNCKIWTGRVASHLVESIAYRRMTIFAPEVAARARAGQFIHILPRAKTSYDPLLRRAFSVMEVEKDDFSILYRIEGTGTQILSQKVVGDEVDFLGPLGEPFASGQGDVILLGGGVGVPPMLMFAQQLRAEGTQTKITTMIGARTENDVLCASDFRRYNVPVEIATDDGSVGLHGQVTQLLINYLNKHTNQNFILEQLTNLSQERNADAQERRRDITVYACGPWAMLKAVANVCALFNVACQVSMEENMPCGIGVCNGCVVPTLIEDDEYSIYRRACIDGPPMWAHEIKW